MSGENSFSVCSLKTEKKSVEKKGKSMQGLNLRHQDVRGVVIKYAEKVMTDLYMNCIQNIKQETVFKLYVFDGICEKNCG